MVSVKRKIRAKWVEEERGKSHIDTYVVGTRLRWFKRVSTVYFCFTEKCQKLSLNTNYYLASSGILRHILHEFVDVLFTLSNLLVNYVQYETSLQRI